MLTLIIPCAGKNTRLSFFNLPKCLLPVKQEPILFKIIKSWEKFINQIIIVVNKENRSVIENYINTYGDFSNIEFVEQEGNGTYFAVKSALPFVRNQRIILNWSDVVLLKEENSLLEINKNVVLTTNKVECRWKFEENFIKETSKSNGIYGIFVISKDSVKEIDVDKDESEILLSFEGKDFIGVNVEDFIDIGDKTKYTGEVREITPLEYFPRTFNSIKKYENVIIKKTKNEKIRKMEENWYKNMNFSFLPRVFDYNPLVIERFDGVPAYYALNENNEDVILNKIFEVARIIHNSKNKIIADKISCEEEYINKTIQRLKRVEFLFKNLQIEDIDGIKYRNPVELLKDLDIYPEEFCPIHGDLQLSNTLIDKDFNLKVIDPRGYFGNTVLFGDPAYDYAKIYYGFVGSFGKFNLGKNLIHSIDNHYFLAPMEEEKIVERRRNKFFQKLEKLDYIKISEKKIDILHSIIWISVSDYIANDVLSCLYAFLLGTKMINKIKEWA